MIKTFTINKYDEENTLTLDTAIKRRGKIQSGSTFFEKGKHYTKSAVFFPDSNIIPYLMSMKEVISGKLTASQMASLFPRDLVELDISFVHKERDFIYGFTINNGIIEDERGDCPEKTLQAFFKRLQFVSGHLPLEEKLKTLVAESIGEYDIKYVNKWLEAWDLDYEIARIDIIEGEAYILAEAGATGCYDVLERGGSGVLKMLLLLGPVTRALQYDHILLISHIELHLHTGLARDLINLFNKPDKSRKAQLLCSITRDPIYLTRDIHRLKETLSKNQQKKLKHTLEYLALT